MPGAGRRRRPRRRSRPRRRAHPSTPRRPSPTRSPRGTFTSTILRGAPESTLDHRAVDRVDSGVVHQQIDAAERRDRPADRLAPGARSSALPATPSACSGRPGCSTASSSASWVAGGDDDPRAVGDQALGDRQADAPARPGDDRGLALRIGPGQHQSARGPSPCPGRRRRTWSRARTACRGTAAS